MVTDLVKPIVENNSSLFQIAAIPGHRSQEHLVTLKNVDAMIDENGVAVAAQVLDPVTDFDSEVILDTLDELY